MNNVTQDLTKAMRHILNSFDEVAEANRTREITHAANECELDKTKNMLRQAVDEKEIFARIIQRRDDALHEIQEICFKGYLVGEAQPSEAHTEALKRIRTIGKTTTDAL